jgi:hypothetical protein
MQGSCGVNKKSAFICAIRVIGVLKNKGIARGIPCRWHGTTNYYKTQEPRIKTKRPTIQKLFKFYSSSFLSLF